MTILTRCNDCNKLLFFSQNKLCEKCYTESKIKIEEKNNKQLQKQIEKNKFEKSKIKKQLANQKLIEELRREKELKKLKKVKSIPKKKKETIKVQKKVIKKVEKTLEKKAEELSEIFETVLYVSATVKRLKIIEWRFQKKKILLNKEREIRHTHKGGWSQEKFQSFVEMQKKKTWEWIEKNLDKEGVLRPPYEQILINCEQEKIKNKLENKLIK